MSKYKAIRVVYRPVTDDLPGQRKILGDEETVELVEFEGETHDGEIVKVRGRTEDGLDVISPTPEYHKATVRAREADEGTYNQNLGWVQRLEGVKA